MLDAYCKKHGLRRASTSFEFDGDKVRDEQTPRELELESDDLIDVVVGH